METLNIGSNKGFCQQTNKQTNKITMILKQLFSSEHKTFDVKHTNDIIQATLLDKYKKG